MIPAIVIAILLAVGGGTVAVSDDSKPGDPLFGIDRAVERVRLTFANDDKKEELRVRFAEERLSELEEIIDEDDSTDDSTEDEQPSDDSGDDSDDDSKIEKVEEGLSFALDLLGEIEDEEKYSDLRERLNGLLNELPENTELDVKLRDSGSSFIKLRSESDSNRFDFEIKETDGGKIIIKTRDGENKVKVEIEDGQRSVEIKPDNRGQGSFNSGRDDDSSDDSDDDSKDDDSDNSGSGKDDDSDDDEKDDDSDNSGSGSN